MSFPGPSYEVVEEVNYDKLQDEFPEFARRTLRTERFFRLFRLRYQNRKKADRDDVRTEFRNTKGGATTTTYNPIDGSGAVTVRFASPDFAWRWLSATTYEFDIVLIEDLK